MNLCFRPELQSRKHLSRFSSTAGYAGLNENGSHLIHSNTWLPVSGIAWEGVGDVVLLKEVCHWRQALGFSKSDTVPA